MQFMIVSMKSILGSSWWSPVCILSLLSGILGTSVRPHPLKITSRPKQYNMIITAEWWPIEWQHYRVNTFKEFQMRTLILTFLQTLVLPQEVLGRVLAYLQIWTGTDYCFGRQLTSNKSVLFFDNWPDMTAARPLEMERPRHRPFLIGVSGGTASGKVGNVN